MGAFALGLLSGCGGDDLKIKGEMIRGLKAPSFSSS